MAKKIKPSAPTAAGVGTSTPGSALDTDEITRLESKLSHIEDTSDKKLRDLEKDFQKRLDDREVRVMEVLAVFVVVLTFVSTNISIFNRISSLSTAVLFMAAMTVCLIAVFSVLFSILYKDKPESAKFRNPFLKWWVIWFPLIATLIIIGAIVGPAATFFAGIISALMYEYL